MAIIFEPSALYAFDTQEPGTITPVDPTDCFLVNEDEYTDIRQTNAPILIGNTDPQDFILFASRIDRNGADEVGYVRTCQMGSTGRYVKGELLMLKPDKHMTPELAHSVLSLIDEEVAQFGLACLHGAAQRYLERLEIKR